MCSWLFDKLCSSSVCFVNNWRVQCIPRKYQLLPAIEFECFSTIIIKCSKIINNFTMKLNVLNFGLFCNPVTIVFCLPILSKKSIHLTEKNAGWDSNKNLFILWRKNKSDYYFLFFNPVVHARCITHSGYVRFYRFITTIFRLIILKNLE